MRRVTCLAALFLLVSCAEDTTPPTAPAISAAASGGTAPKLSIFKGGGASVGWSSAGGSSPGDASNDVALQIQTKANAGSGGGAFTYGRDEVAVGIVGLSLGAVDHLGFDSRGYLQPGAPRLVVTTMGTDGGHIYHLAAWHCNAGANPNNWVTSNFLSPSCTVFRDGAVPFAGLGAAAAVADANNEVITDWFLIQDEGPAIVYIDRLTVQDWMWVRGGGPGVRSCLDTNPTCI